MTLAGVGARALFLPLRADLSPDRRGRRQAAWLQSVRTVLPKTSNPISGGNGAWRQRSPACVTGAASPTAARPHGQGLAPFNQASLKAVRTIAPPHGFDLASAKAPRLGAGARRAAAILAALGRRVTDADAAVVDAILALPAKLDPLRAAALTALRRPSAPAPCPRGPATLIACPPPRRTGAPVESEVPRECRPRPRRPCRLCSRPMRPCAGGARPLLKRSPQFGRPRHDRGLRPA